MVHDSLTFGDLLKEVGGEPEVRPTFRFLFGERSSDHRSILSIKAGIYIFYFTKYDLKLKENL